MRFAFSFKYSACERNEITCGDTKMYCRIQQVNAVEIQKASEVLTSDEGDSGNPALQRV